RRADDSTDRAGHREERLPMVVAGARPGEEHAVPDATRRRDAARGRGDGTSTGRSIVTETRPMYISKIHLPRRTILRGLGAAVALPFLEAMVPAMTALAQTAAKPARRLGVFYVPNGMAMSYWSPKSEGPL